MSDQESVPRTQSTRVVVAFDDEWHDRFGASAETYAHSLLSESSSLFRGMFIHLMPVRTELWASPREASSTAGLLAAAKRMVSLGDADIVVAFSAQATESGDGRAEIGGRYALVRHHEGHPERDAPVLAHEIAHLFGASHGCDLPGAGGIMAAEGFEAPELICPCTRQILELNAERFHAQ